MYGELIARIRYHIQKADFMGLKEYESTRLLNEAADAIEELLKITTHYEEESKGWWLAACDAKEERERLKEQIPKWIPVTERLPEKNYNCLVADDGTIVYGYMNFIGEWMDCLGDKLKYVSHWMPLPQPPETEN